MALGVHFVTAYLRYHQLFFNGGIEHSVGGDGCTRFGSKAQSSELGYGNLCHWNLHRPAHCRSFVVFLFHPSGNDSLDELTVVSGPSYFSFPLQI